MKAHEFARQLLAGPDLTIMVYRDSRDEGLEDNLVTNPVVVEEEGEDTRTGEERRFLVIAYAEKARSVGRGTGNHVAAQDNQNPSSSSSATLSVTEGEEKEPSAWRKERSFSRPSLFDRIRMALKYPSEWSLKKDSFTLISNLPEWTCDILIRQLSQTTPIPLRPPGYFNDCYDRSAAEESNRLAYGRIGGSVCANCPVDAGPCPICGTIWERQGIERIGRLVVPRQAPSVGPGTENRKTAQDKPKPVSSLSVTEAHPKEEVVTGTVAGCGNCHGEGCHLCSGKKEASSEPVNLPRQNELTPLIAARLVAIRDALIGEDYGEAYHQLYAIADETFEKPMPWCQLEELAEKVILSERDGKQGAPPVTQTPSME